MSDIIGFLSFHDADKFDWPPRSSSLLRLACHAAVVYARYVSPCNTCEPWDGAGRLSLEWFPEWPIGSRMKTNAVEMTLALRLANRSVLHIEVVLHHMSPEHSFVTIDSDTIALHSATRIARGPRPSSAIALQSRWLRAEYADMGELLTWENNGYHGGPGRYIGRGTLDTGRSSAPSHSPSSLIGPPLSASDIVV